MAKKTKKQKILADYHRKLQAIEEVAPKYVLPKANIIPSPQPLTPSPSNYSYVFHDLKRILFLTALAISAQLVLWYAIGKN